MAEGVQDVVTELDRNSEVLSEEGASALHAVYLSALYADRHNLPSLRQWAQYELAGYPFDADMPGYRVAKQVEQKVLGPGMRALALMNPPVYVGGRVGGREVGYPGAGPHAAAVADRLRQDTEAYFRLRAEGDHGPVRRDGCPDGGR